MADTPDWYIELGLGIPDSTTEAIEELDKRLVVAEDMELNSVCMMCDKPGFHVHWIGES